MGRLPGCAEAVAAERSPIYYRLLLQHEPLDAAFGKKLVDDVLSCMR